LFVVSPSSQHNLEGSLHVGAGRHEALDLFDAAADAVAEVLAETTDWGPSGLRHSQYAFDVSADEACLGVLHRAGVAVLSEESGITGDAGAPVVIVDPVDGSTNASRGVPWFATALCLMVEGRAEVALVANHATGQRWRAVVGGGASLDGRPISTSGQTELSKSIVAMSGLPSQHYGWAQFRSFGASAPDLCLVASGVTDAWCDMNDGGHGVWDYAASMLICLEAGAAVAEVHDRDLFTLDHRARRTPVAAATPELLEVILEHRRADA
jgi:fructose-1,6-bisphosphatase/inositol monophosphatase family enzyme